MRHVSTPATILKYARRGALLLVLLALLRPLGASAQAVVSTLAGGGANGTTPGLTDGTGTTALFNNPFGVALDGAGNVYVADYSNNKIRKVSPAGVVTTLAGGGPTGARAGATDGTGTAALFDRPDGVAVDGAGNVYVADTYNHKIRKVSPAGVVTTLAGGGANGTTNGSTNGTGIAALFYSPTGVAVDGAGNVYVADYNNNKIRKVSPAGVVTTLAGGGANGATAGSTDGTGTVALFYSPIGVAVDGAGNVYVGDFGNRKIRKVSSAGVVTTLAGGGANGITFGSTDGTGTAALFRSPRGVALDGAGNVYVADDSNHKIRKVSPAGVVTTLAGGGTDGITQGSTDGMGTAALFTFPAGVAVDGAGNVYVADTFNHKIRKIMPASTGLATAPARTAAQVQLYPNPAHARFAVLVPGVVGAAAVQAELLNALGQVVRRQSAVLPASGATLTVETSGLTPGIYTLRLLAGGAALARRVVVE